QRNEVWHADPFSICRRMIRMAARTQRCSRTWHTGCARVPGPGENTRTVNIAGTAQSHFRKLVEREGNPGLGVRLTAVDPGTPRADARLEFAEPSELAGDEWAVDCEGFTLYVAADSVRWLDGAEIDYVFQGTGALLPIRAPQTKCAAPVEAASPDERVRRVWGNDSIYL